MSAPQQLIDLSPTDNRSYWCEAEPNVQRAWSPSSLDTLQQCGRKYYYEYIVGYRGKDTPAQAFGKYFHRSIEEYDTKRLEGWPLNDCIHHTAEVALRISKGWASDERERNRFTLLRSVVWYAEKWKNTDLRPLVFASGKPAIEVSFKLALPLVNPDGEYYLLNGYIDVLAEYHGEVLVVDRKTTARTINDYYWDNFDNANQPSAYIVAAQSLMPGKTFHGMLIDAAQTGVTFTEFYRNTTTRNPDRIEDWVHNTVWWIRQAEQYATSNYWPQNQASCNNFGGCPFRSICAMSPAARTPFLRSQFTIKRRETIDRITD
jgi:hypothetical protein